MNPENDQQLRQLFRELRAHDAQRVLAFSSVTHEPATVSRTVPWLRLAAGVALVMAAVVFLTFLRQPAPNTQQWAALSNWRASTDGLLTGSSMSWGRTFSTPTDSWFTNSTQTIQKETL